MAKQEDKKQAIIFTRKQFQALLKTVYLGNWMANANRVHDMQKDYESTEDYIFSKASRFGLERYVDHEESDGERYYPTSYFEEETDVNKLHEEYDEETMWDELTEHLGERDFLEKYSAEEIKKMSQKDYFFKISECVDFYHDEFAKFGLERIRIKEK